MRSSIPGLVALSEPMPESGGQIQGNSPLKGNLDLVSLLVRECVQNAWDARDDDRGNASVQFSIDAWDFDADEVKQLRQLLPVRDLPEDGFGSGVEHPRGLWGRSSLRVLIISDRRTVGLCGPTRSGKSWRPVRDGRPLERGQQRFANFVRNTGRAARNIGGGDGGAYGVGKSVLWMASRCGTVLIHSRTTDELGQPVARFIGSIHGNDFATKDGVEYTGRHFIGVRADRRAGTALIEPLTGASAAAAAEMMKIPSYEVDGEATDGTSIVILDPRLTLGWELECPRIVDAVRWHVWPKRVPGLRGSDSEPDMDIHVRLNGHDRSIPSPLDDQEIRPYAVALQHLVTGRVEREPGLDKVIRCGRPLKDLGMLKFREAGAADQNVFHVTGAQIGSSPADRNEEEFEPDAEPIVEFEKPWGQIALIRREPLLLVRYEAIGGKTDAMNHVGVFLSADDPVVEDALTKAEPPAHNDWDHRNIQREGRSDHRPTYAKRTIEELKKARAEFLSRFAPATSTERVKGERALSAAVSKGLFGGQGGPVSPSRGGGGGQADRSSKPRARLSHVDSRADSGTSVHELEVTLENITADSSGVTLTAQAPAWDLAGRIDAGDDVAFRWLRPGEASVEGPRFTAKFQDGEVLTLVLTVRGNLRIRPAVIVGVDNAS